MAKTTCTKNLVKFGSTVFELCEQTDIQTDAKTNLLRNPNGQSKYATKILYIRPIHT